MNEARNAYIRQEVARNAVAGVRQIVAEVCQKYGLSKAQLISQRRARDVAWPRQEVMYRAYKETPASLPLIGRELGGLDHTTVLFGVRAYQRRMSKMCITRRDSEPAPITPLSTNCSR